ncbi:hypothetical protein [Chitinophaga qingshengii]|uniref:Uncharacterized protein n=1 Tax=Chitinophaga qingshengii TaxID=1569794 RepID=A0ABR7TSE3_9BACT|nr:hypothetical protein [Chitinophaga qingshengii]MBC9932940.1 hypothetical protein [Chitinophaga qingshengii]
MEDNIPNEPGSVRRQRKSSYRSGRRSFDGAPKDVARYALWDLWLRWALLILIVIFLMIYCWQHGMPESIIAVFSLLKKWI